MPLNPQPEDVRWQFVEASMAALGRLKAALAEAEEIEGGQQKGAMLSVKAESAVSSLMQGWVHQSNISDYKSDFGPD